MLAQGSNATTMWPGSCSTLGTYRPRLDTNSSHNPWVPLHVLEAKAGTLFLTPVELTALRARSSQFSVERPRVVPPPFGADGCHGTHCVPGSPEHAANIILSATIMHHRGVLLAGSAYAFGCVVPSVL